MGLNFETLNLVVGSQYRRESGWLI